MALSWRSGSRIGAKKADTPAVSRRDCNLVESPSTRKCTNLRIGGEL
jgi:hypothetical protein